VNKSIPIYINLFPRIDVPEVVTQGVHIQASPLYIPEASSGQANLWAYSITITMASTEAITSRCKLVSRYWEITVNRNTSVTQGPGVIGLYPDVYPGSFFRYESCSPIKGTSGTMGGFFVFKRQDGVIFHAIVPTMTFKIPEMIQEEENLLCSKDTLTQRPIFGFLTYWSCCCWCSSEW